MNVRQVALLLFLLGELLDSLASLVASEFRLDFHYLFTVSRCVCQ